MLNIHKSYQYALMARFLSCQPSTSYSTQSAKSSHDNYRKKSTVEIPMRKEWGKTAVLKALNEATPPHPLKYVRYPFDCPSNPVFSFLHKSKIIQSMTSGKLPVEQLKSTDPKFFELDWIESPGFESNYKDVDPDEGQCDPEFQESTKELEELMQNKGAVEVALTCIQFLKKGVKISEATMDKCIAFITFYATKPSKSKVGILELLSVISQHGTLSQSAKSMVLRCAAWKKYPHCIQMFENVKKNGIPDIETINYLLNSRRNNMENSILCFNIFNDLRKNGLYPTIETFCGYQCCVNMHHSERKLANAFTSCLGEIKACEIEETFEFYLTMLSISHGLKYNNLAHAILNHLEDKKLRAPENSVKRSARLLSSIMRNACENSDLEMAQKLWKISLQDSYSRVLIESDEPWYFFWYFKTVLKCDSLDNTVKAMRDLVPGVIRNINMLLHELFTAAKRHESPEFLVYIYAEVSNGIMDYTIASSWLRIAVTLCKTAEMETLQQFKNICLIFVSSLRREKWKISSQFLSDLAFLIAKSRDTGKLMNVMSQFKKKYPSIKIDDLTLAECYSAIRDKNDSSLLLKLQQLYPEPNIQLE